jgi:hypothetical protein
MALSRSDLQFHYEGAPVGDDDPRKTGIPDSTELNRHEGYEVLHFVNRYASTHTPGGTADKLYGERDVALKAERGLQKVPGDVRSHAGVVAWLKDHWKEFE